MNFLKSKFVIILTILIAIIISGGFFAKKQINKNFLDSINESSIFKENIKFGKVEYNIFLLKNEIELSNVSINFESNKEKKADFYRQIYIPRLKIQLGFFQIFQSIFQKNIKIKKILLENPSFNINISKDNNYLKNLFLNEIKKINTSIEIVDGYFKIQHPEESLSQIFDKINGNFVLNTNQSIKTNLIFKNQENFYEISGKIQNLKNNFYNLKFLLENDKNSLNYSANLEIDNQKIKSLNGEIESLGPNLNEFMNFLFINNQKSFCENQKKQENTINNLRFQINAKTIIDGNFLKINDIKINFRNAKNNNQINGLILYNFSEKKIYTSFNSTNLDFRTDEKENKKDENLNFKDIFEKILNGQFSNVKNYFLFLKKYESENFFDFKEIIFNEEIKINNFNSEFDSKNNNFIVKNFKFTMNDIYDLKIENAKNSTNSQKIFKITIDKNQMNFFELDAFFIDSNLIIENFKLTKNITENQIKEEIIGKIKIKSHDKSNFISGDLIFRNINFNQNLINNNENQELKQILKNFEIKKDQTGGDFVKNLLFLTERYNLFYDINLKFENFNFNSHNLENFELKAFIKNNKIISSISGQNSLMGKFQINTLMMFKAFKPYIEADINIEKFLLNKFVNEFFKNSIFLTEKEFKENNNQNIWRNFNFNFNPIKNLESKIELKIKNSKINDQEIQNIYSQIKSTNNIVDINELKIKIDEISNINLSINLEIEKMLFKGSFETSNINYKNLFLKNQEKLKNDQLFLSDIELTSIGKFSTSGQNFDNFIQNFNGNIKYYGQNAIFNKIDINNFINEFDNAKNNNKLISLTEQSVINGETIFDEIQGDISIRNNVIENIFDFSSKNFNGAGSLNMFLRNLTFKGLLRFIFFSKNNNKNLNFFDLNINGNFFNINKTIDINSISYNK